MSAALIVTTSAVSASAAALAAKRNKQEIENCAVLISEFNPRGDVQSKQQYASCVQKIYPVENKDTPPIAQGIVAFILLGIITGLIYEKFRKLEYTREKKDYVLAGIVGGVSTMMIVFLIIALLFVSTAFI